MARSIHDRLNAAVQQLEEAGHIDSAAAVKAVAEPGGWTLLRSRQAAAGGKRRNLTLTMSEDLKAALTDAADEFGVVLSTAVSQGFQRALAGKWLPAKARSGSGAVLNVSVGDDLYMQVQEALPGLSERAGYKVSRSSIAIGWLAEELGVELAAGSSLSMMLPKPLRDHFKAAEKSGVVLQEVLEDGIRSLLEGGDMPGFRAWALVSARKRNPDGTWQKPEKSAAPAEPAKLTVPVDHELGKALHETAPRLSKELGALLHPGTIARGILTDRLGEPAE